MSEPITYSRNGQLCLVRSRSGRRRVTSSVGRAIDVAKSIAGIDGVATACAVNGPYDVIALAEAVDIDDLCQAIVGKIQTVDGITRTLTCRPCAPELVRILPGQAAVNPPGRPASRDWIIHSATL